MSSTVVIASTAEDAAAAEAMMSHHSQLAGELMERVTDALAAAQPAVESETAARARAELVAFCRDDLLPHANAEESALYPLARADARARLLIDAMISEHRTLGALVDSIDAAGSAVEVAAEATALRVLFTEHLFKENNIILPLLAGSAEVSLAAALRDMQELLGGSAGSEGAGEPRPSASATGMSATSTSATAKGGCGGNCTCGAGGDTPAAEPVLDVRTVPHPVRHAVIFGALEAVVPGATLVLLAPHDPLPLLRQLQERHPGAFVIDYLERGPEDWRLRLTRTHD